MEVNMDMDRIQGLTADGFDAAVIGHEPNRDAFVYDRQKMIEIAVLDMGMTEEDAVEYLEYNVWGAYVGEHTPIYINTGTLTQITD
jgi:hypothetical protein